MFTMDSIVSSVETFLLLQQLTTPSPRALSGNYKLSRAVPAYTTARTVPQKRFSTVLQAQPRCSRFHNQWLRRAIGRPRRDYKLNRDVPTSITAVPRSRVSNWYMITSSAELFPLTHWQYPSKTTWRTYTHSCEALAMHRNYSIFQGQGQG